MTEKISDTMKLGEMVARYPCTGDVLQQFQIDFCCGGNRPLREAIEERGLSAELVVNKLNEACERIQPDQTQVDWGQKSCGELADYVVHRHHAYLNVELPQLSELTTKILRVHGANHGELQQVHRWFHTLKMDMEQHMIKEETDAFPAIRDYERDPSREKLKRVVEIIETLEAEHNESGDLLKKIREAANHYAIPADACPTFARTYAGLEKLESDMFQHVHLENNVLFPRLQREYQQMK